MEISVVGIDLAKDSFSICEMSRGGKVLRRKELTRRSLKEYLNKLPTTLIAFEACGGSHYWARIAQKHGHQVKMITPQRVKPFAPAHKKNDASDAEAICLAALSESTRSVAVKSCAQQDVSVLLNLREQLTKQKVALKNQMHAIGLEYGVALAKSWGARGYTKIMEELEDADNELTTVAREAIRKILELVRKAEVEIEQLSEQIHELLKPNENYGLLRTIPGIGPMTAAAIVAHTGGSVAEFKNGRQFAAYIGLVPRQYSTGGKTRLGSITRCGSPTIRSLLVVGTVAVLCRAKGKQDKVNQWAAGKSEQMGFRKANVALANKTARIAFAVLKTKTPYAAKVAA